MNISTKSEYDLQALIYLASNDEGGAIPDPEIAERWSVPVKHLEQIIKTLADLCTQADHPLAVSLKSSSGR